MREIILLIFITSVNLCYSQDYDKNWLIGRFVSYDGSIITFNDNSIEVKNQKLGIETIFGGISMSNKDGHIQFYSNGTAIASAIDHKIMKNGRGLSLGSDGEDYENSGLQIVPRKSFLAYPDSENDSIYYLIYSYLIKDENYFEISDFLQIAKIDMRKNDGKGEVVYKNKILFNQKSVNKLDIVKHAMD